MTPDPSSLDLVLRARHKTTLDWPARLTCLSCRTGHTLAASYAWLPDDVLIFFFRDNIFSQIGSPHFIHGCHGYCSYSSSHGCRLFGLEMVPLENEKGAEGMLCIMFVAELLSISLLPSKLCQKSLSSTHNHHIF